MTFLSKKYFLHSENLKKSLNGGIMGEGEAVKINIFPKHKIFERLLANAKFLYTSASFRHAAGGL